MDYSIEITNSNGDVFYNTIDAVIVDQANGWPDISPEIRRELARRGLESLSQSLAIDYLSEAIVEGDNDTLRGTKGRTYASMVSRGLDIHLTELVSKTDAIDFELSVGGLAIHVTYDSADIETFDDAIWYVMHDPDTPTNVREALNSALNSDLIRGHLRDYYDYVAWNEHGNQPSYSELAEDGGIVDSVLDLISEPCHHVTQYLMGGANADNGMTDDAQACQLLVNRAAIQHLYGIEPDWNLWE